MSEAMNNRKKLVIAIVVVTILVISIIIIRFPLTVGSIVVPDYYSSIQTAIDHALVGQTIYVRSGVYTEQSITINKPVSLVGENPTNTILVGINNIKYSPPYVIQVSADSVRISGFTIINGSLGGIRIETIGSDKQPSGCTITGNIISNNNIGISTYDGQDLTISYNQIFNNTEGVSVSSSHSQIIGNRIANNRFFGVNIDSCRDVSISNNDISENGIGATAQDEKGGICLRWFGDFRVFGNNITGNNGDGVQFGEGCSNSLIYDNNILGNEVGVDLFNFAISNNSENIGIGSNNQVYKNNLVNSPNAVVETSFAYGNLSNIYYAIGNGTDIVSWDNGEVGNYWSDYNGSETYIVDPNNIDHHPLSQFVSISTRTANLPLLPTNANQGINQVLLRIEYGGNWYGIFGEPNFTKTGWGGSSNSSVVINRPDGVYPWIIVSNTQGFHTREFINLTVSISELNGHILAIKSVDSYDGAIIILNVDVDNPSSNVTYDFTTDSATIT